MAAAFLALILAAVCPPVAAQNAPPTFLFVLENGGSPTGTIRVFRVNSSTGAIAEAPGSPFNAGLGPASLALDPTGRFLYIANNLSDDVTAFSVDPASGALTQLAGSPSLIGGETQAIGIDPTGRFLYVFAVNGPGQSLYEFTIDGMSGVLTAIPPAASPGGFTTGIAFDPMGNYAYLSTGSPGPGSANPIVVCSIDFTTGGLAQVGSAQPVAGGASLAAVSPNSNFVFSFDTVTSKLDAFETSSQGLSLAEIPQSPYPIPVNPFSMAVHPSGNFLYVVNEGQNFFNAHPPSSAVGSVSAFSIDPGSGALTTVAGSPFTAGINPLSVVVDPSGSFAYTTSTTYPNGATGFAQIMGFSIDRGSGKLAPLSWSPWTDTVPGNGTQLAISFAPPTTTNPVPLISSLSPSSAIATAAPFTLQVNGSNFVDGATVYFDGQARSTTFVSSSELTASMIGSDINNGGTAVIFVFNPPPGGGASTSVEFPISNPSPVISVLGPVSIPAGTGPVTLFVSGSNFVTSSVVNFNGTALATSYISPTLLTVLLSADEVVAPATVSITVSNPSNGISGAGGTSGALTLTITPFNPQQPVVTGISPTSAVAGGPGFALTVNGSGFVSATQNSPGSQVTFNLVPVATTFVSSTQLTAFILASEISVPGNPYLIVTNPNGFASAHINFVIAFPQPGGGTVTPPSAPAGANALVLTVTGTGFVPASVVLVNGNPRKTTFLSSTSLQPTLAAADLSQPGTLTITVQNPSPGGGVSQAISFAVTDFSLTLTTSSPPEPAGQPAVFQLTLAPQNGAFSSQVIFSASGLPTGATASFAPSASMTPGTGPQTVTLSIATTSRSAGAVNDRREPVVWSNTAEILSMLVCFLFVSFLLLLWREINIHARFIGVPAGKVREAFFRSAGTLALLALVGLYSIQNGCGYAASPTSSSSGAASTPTPAVNIAGDWSFATTSSKSTTQSTIAGNIVQSGSSISASLNIQGSPCGTTASLSGSVSAMAVTASMIESGQTVTLAGTVAADAKSASGTYSAPAGGCLNGDSGTWTGSKSAVVTNPNGTPSGDYPILVTATAGALAHSTSVTLRVM